MQIGDEPVAVTGDENRSMSLTATGGWEGAASRVIRKSEDLPEMFEMVMPPWTEVCRLILRINREIPGSIQSVRGFFFARTFDKKNLSKEGT